ncbi:Glycylpeptide N-tetradecanoyltransferase [Ilyonectria robusta]|uniref:Glycylpeptide N-tetradecanoyltransferase n=1 Tax=Ilyonectria robusta TaxID=1079257 RepID=UPI001E8E60C7|nr:Glycylpeptide N-tetradecanoyltransferase [Ilyonectria robusta]KAH8734562.1 Glycylpeptide N-tetradecanoyltransferase [Ilyonectria robusta]
MPPEDSKPVEPVVDDKGKQVAAAESESDDDEEPTAGDAAPAAGSAAKKKKKRSKRSKVKEALTGKSSEDGGAEADLKKALSSLTPQQIQEFIALNPALAREVAESSGSANPSADEAATQLRKMNLQDIMTGLAASGKNAKDMGSYKFWQTQPVPRFGEEGQLEEGPLRLQKVEDVPTEPGPLVAGFEWVTMDLTNDDEIKEVYELLNGHYVEDDEAMFRFNYSPSILRWAMMPPGWKKDYHVGVRATQSRKLVAFISAIPVNLRVRNKHVMCSEVNFLSIHKKLRGKRLTPVLIKEITRRSNLNEIWQGLYTAGVVLPKPVSTCRYYHRALNWQKLYEVGFSPLPANSKPQYQVRKYALPDNTNTKGLRAMEDKDLDAVMSLYKKYMARYDMVPDFTREEAYHWFVPKIEPSGEQVVWTYVVEDADKNITDFFSFFSIESSAIGNAKHSVIRVAYMFYYASEVGLSTPFDKSTLKTRLNELIHDALILAKRFKFDVFNALSLMDNALFLEQQKFGAGDGQLHYYLFNYRLNPIAGGVDRKNQLDEKTLSGIGTVMP